MQAAEKGIGTFLRQYRELVIPVYQRNYDWKKENCAQLFADIERIASNNYEMHFIGTICTQAQNFATSVIIDGQQRITSIMLLLKAIAHNTEEEKLKSYIESSFLFGSNWDSEAKMKLKPIKKDEGVFAKLISSKCFNENEYTQKEKESNVYQNYIFFADKVKQSNKTLEEIESAVERLDVVELGLQHENPQVIFEGLNSTGLDLTNTDLLRNYLLMALDYGVQERLYNDYWLKMEEMIGSDRMEEFMLLYLIMKRKSNSIIRDGKKAILNANTLYYAFKKSHPNINDLKSKENVETTLADMYKYAQYYCVFINSVTDKKDKTASLLYELFNQLGEKSSAILLMPIYERYKNNVITCDDLNNVIQVIISFVFRSKVCKKYGMSTQTAALSLQRLDTMYDNTKTLSDNMYAILSSFNGSYMFPKDKEFEETLITTDIYATLKSNGCRYLLGKIEKSMSKETVDVSDATIEHIIPQTLSKEWTNYLGQYNDLHEHEKCLHTLGNLTLTKYNSELSNDIFSVKQKIYHDSNFAVTRQLSGYQQFTSRQVYGRARKLAKIALEIWKLPTQYNTEFKVTPDKNYTLDTDFGNFTYTKLESVHLFGENYAVSHWSEAWRVFNKILYNTYKFEYLKAAQLNWITNQTPIVSDAKSDRYNCEIAENECYLCKGLSTQSILFYMNEIITKMDTEMSTNLRSDIWFNIKDENNKETNIDETRKEYWEKLNAFLKQDSTISSQFVIPNATNYYWQDIKINIAECHILLSQIRNQHKLQIGIYIPDNQDLFNELKNKEQTIKNILKQEIEYSETDKGKAKKIMISKNVDFLDSADIEKQFEFIKDSIVKFKNIIETCNNVTIKKQFTQQKQGIKRTIIPQTEFVIPEKMKDLYNEVDSTIKSIDDRIEQTKMAVYVKYTIDDKIICTISGNNSKLKMCFNVDIDELSDPYNLLEDVSQKGHHGIGNSRIVFNDNSHIDEITDFVKQVVSII